MLALAMSGAIGVPHAKGLVGDMSATGGDTEIRTLPSVEAAGRRRSQGILCLHDSEGVKGSPPGVNQQRAPPRARQRSAVRENDSGRVRMYGLHRFAGRDASARDVNREQYGDNCQPSRPFAPRLRAGVFLVQNPLA